MYMSLLALLLPFLLLLAPLTGMPLPDQSAPIAHFEAVEDFRIASGTYICPNDGSVLKIAPLAGESYSVQISLYRLTLQDGLGAYKDGVLVVSAEDAAGGVMIWHIKKEGDVIRAGVHSSAWGLLSEGTVFEFKAE